jgi:hypothetical protein
MALDLARTVGSSGTHEARPASATAVRPYIESSRGYGTTLAPADRQRAPQPAHPALSAVRIHTGAAAAAAARRLEARAFTSGTDVFLGAGFAPGTADGRRLLAHELTHVLHPAPAGRDGQAIQLAPEVPVQPTVGTSRASLSGRGVAYLIQYDIQWHYITLVAANYGDFDLVVTPPSNLAGSLTAREVAQSSVSVLLAAMGVPVKSGGQEVLVARVAQDIEAHGLLGSAGFRLPVDAELVSSQFEQDRFQEFLTAMHDQLRGQLVVSPLVAGGDFAGRPATTPIRPATARSADTWAAAKARQLRALIAETRARRSPPPDLPDDVAAEADPRTGSWSLRVWAQFGADKGHRVDQAIPLRREEALDDLLVRARAAVNAALQEDSDAQQAAESTSAPEWARALARRLEELLAQVRRAEPSATDVPDGTALEARAEVRLRVWVQRQSETSVERNAGTVPLSQQTTADSLLPYVRRLSAVLRQYENAPDAVPEGVQVTLDPEQAALAAFPAHLAPVDLRSDNVTVTGARNEFSMVLDFEAVYGGGDFANLYIASKLYSQYIHLFWEVYRLPPDLPLPQGTAAPPAQWERRWSWLDRVFNPPGPRTAQWGADVRSKLGTPVTSTDGSDFSARVPLPDVAGDYVIRCVTGHAPIGPDRVRRLSSEAYYPVRVEPIREVAASTAGARAEAITLTEKELASIDADLAGAPPDQRQAMLLAQRQYRSSYLDRLRRRETLNLAEGTAEELDFARKTVDLAQRLAALEPGLKESARAKGVPPSSLITDPDLLTLYWFIIAEHKTVEGYRQELAAHLEYLTGLAARAREFGSEIKAGSPYQYSVTGAFVSELTGQLYPLVFMLGEAPDTSRAVSGRAPIAPRVVYTLVDVTDRRTQKRYFGMSLQPGPTGHREAIDNAFEAFGDAATYGEGLVAVRIPAGRAGLGDPNHPGTGTRYYRSAEGPLQKVLWALGIIAAVAGLAALAATGVGAPAAAAVLGLVAGVAGAAVSLHNISERAARHTLEWDAELALDVIGIIGVVPAAAGTRLALAARAAGFANVTRAGRFLQFYGWAEMGATAVLVPVKMADDIHRIEADTSLSDEQKKKLVDEAKAGALQAGLMMVGSMTASRMGGHAPGRTGPPEDAPGLQRQIELLDLEGFAAYRSMEERGYLDANGHWTEAARRLAPPPPEPGPPAKRPAAGEHPAAPAGGAPARRQPAAAGPRSAVSEAPIGDRRHRVQYRDGSIHLCTDCEQLALRLAQLEILVPGSRPSYDQLEALNLEVRAVQAAVSEGSLAGAALDARVRSVSERLGAIADGDPAVADLLNLDNATMERLTAARHVDPIEAGRTSESRGVPDDPAGHFGGEGFSTVGNRPPARVSPTQPGVTRGQLKARMKAAGMAPTWATSPADWNPHHVIPMELENHRVLDQLRAHGGWDHTAAVNGYPLPTRPGIEGAEHLPVHQVTGKVTAPEPPPQVTGQVTAPEPPPQVTGQVTAPEPAPQVTGQVTAPEPAPRRTPQTARDLSGHPVWNEKVADRLDDLANRRSAVDPSKLLIERPDELRAAVLDLIADLKGDIELSRARGVPVLF